MNGDEVDIGVDYVRLGGAISYINCWWWVLCLITRKIYVDVTSKNEELAQIKLWAINLIAINYQTSLSIKLFNRSFPSDLGFFQLS